MMRPGLWPYRIFPLVRSSSGINFAEGNIEKSAGADSIEAVSPLGLASALPQFPLRYLMEL